MLDRLSRAGQLRRGILGIADAFALSFALLALVLASSLATTGAAAKAGAATPLAYLLAGVGSLCLASVIVRFTRRMASAGGLYTYTSRGLNHNAGFIGGWLYTWGFAVGVSFVLVIAAVYMSTVLTEHAGIHVAWFPCFLILLAALTIISLLDIRISTRTQLVVAALGVSVIVVLLLVILAKGGDSGINLQPFNPSQANSAHDFFQAMVFAFTGYIGFEAAAALGEEAASPLKVIPKAILSAVIVGLVYYVFLTWVMALGFGVDNIAKWGQDPTALDTLATRYVGGWFATLVDIAVVVDSFVACLAGTALASRTAFAMAREGGLPRVFAWTHPRFRTPWISILATMLLTLILTTWLARSTYDPFTYFAFMATTATFGILFVYMLISVAGMVYFWRTRDATEVAYNIVLDVVLPVGAIIICGLTIYWSIFPRPPAPISYAPYIAGGWFLLGCAILVWLNVKAPERVRAFGAVLAEGSAEERGIEAAPAPSPMA